MEKRKKSDIVLTGEVISDKAEKTIAVKLDERPTERTDSGTPQGQPEPQMNEKLGLDIQNLTPEIAKQLGYENEQGGVLVANVISGSPAEDARLQRGDLIKEVNRTAFNNVQAFNSEVAKLQSGESAALLVRRGQNNFFVAISIP